MVVTLSPQIEALIQKNVDSGRFSDATEVIEEAVRQMDERDRVERLRASLVAADERIDRGEGVDWTPEHMERLIRESAEDSRNGVPIPDHD
jgi:putative addiction module CopG family antidote